MASNIKFLTGIAVKNMSIVKEASGDTYYATWTALSNANQQRVKNMTAFWYEWVINESGNGVWRSLGSNQTGISSSATRTKSVSPSSSSAYKIKCKLTTYIKKKYQDDYCSSWATAERTLESHPLAPETPSAPTGDIRTGSDNILDVEWTASSSYTQSTLEGKFILYRGGEAVSETEWTSIPLTGVRTITGSFTLTTGIAHAVCVMLRCTVNGVTYCSSESDPYTVSAASITYPSQVTGLTASAVSSTEVYLAWTAEPTAASTDGYKISYTYDESFFGTGQNEYETPCSTTHATIQVETGKTWYFRVKAINANGNAGPWSEIKQAAAALAPNAPTTWTLSSSMMIGGTIKMYCTHNSADGSKPTKAKFAYKLSSASTWTEVEETYSLGPDDDDYTIYHTFEATSGTYFDGDTIQWKAATIGVQAVGYGDYSATREIKIYTQPVVSTNCPTTVSSYPLAFNINVTPVSQTPVSCSVSIVSLYDYAQDNEYGEDARVVSGSEVYSKVFTGASFTTGATQHTLALSLLPSDVRLADGQTYKMYITVAMNSGLSADITQQIGTNLGTSSYTISYAFVVDTDNCMLAIAPAAFVTADPLETLYSGVIANVYRINSDNTFTLIAENLVNSGDIYALDNYPALGTSNYRIVCTNTSDGSIQFADASTDLITEKSIIIQWGQQELTARHTQTFTAESLAELASGITLKLKGNITIQESNEFDVELINYIGRKNPVAYYGTQTGYSASWSADVPKTDTDTLRLLRQLQVYPGDVYVREPSGTGYWANVAVSFDISYDNSSQVIPVTIDVKRVDGGE